MTRAARLGVGLACLGAALACAAPPLPQARPPAPGWTHDPLSGRSLAVPVHGVRVNELRDTFNAARGSMRRHEAVDIAAPLGRPVYAADDGTLVKLFQSVPGGLTVYQFDPDRRVAYYYAHLDRYADGLREGMALRRCDLIGYVGVTGNAPPDAPHLHFAVFRLGVLKQWWGGVAIDPLPALRAGAAAGVACGG